jgi:sec-independent protein translocase protein TatC
MAGSPDGGSTDDDRPAEVDAAATVEELRAGNGDDAGEGAGKSTEATTDDRKSADTATDDDGPAEATTDDSSTTESDEVGPRSEDGGGTDDDTDAGGIDDPSGPPDVPESDRDGPVSDDSWPDDRGASADSAEVTGTDGGTPTTVDDVATGTAGSEEPLVDDGLVSEGPETDEEMPLADHIEEMIRRLAVVLGVGGVITLVLYPGADLVNSAFGLELVSSTEVIDFLWNKHVPGAPELTDRRPRVYGPLELLLTELKVAALGGLVVGLPVFIYETYLFMRPGLYLKERRYYLAAVPTSIVLAFVGISFAHFIVLPAIFAYFTSYTTGTAVVAFGLKETFNLILILMGYNAVIFQIPLFIMLAIMMNLVTRTWLEARRLLFWGAFLGVAFLVSPDPTGMAPIIIGATMITLFEGTLLALRWTRSGDGAAA